MLALAILHVIPPTQCELQHTTNITVYAAIVSTARHALPLPAVLATLLCQIAIFFRMLQSFVRPTPSAMSSAPVQLPVTMRSFHAPPQEGAQSCVRPRRLARRLMCDVPSMNSLVYLCLSTPRGRLEHYAHYGQIHRKIFIFQIVARLSPVEHKCSVIWEALGGRHWERSSFVRN